MLKREAQAAASDQSLPSALEAVLRDPFSYLFFFNITSYIYFSSIPFPCEALRCRFPLIIDFRTSYEDHYDRPLTIGPFVEVVLFPVYAPTFLGKRVFPTLLYFSSHIPIFSILISPALSVLLALLIFPALLVFSTLPVSHYSHCSQLHISK